MYALAIIPGIILFIIVWKFDKVEKEPPGLLIKLFLCGALTIISAVLLGLLGKAAMNLVISDTRSLLYILIESFIFTALVEEGGRFLALKLLTWKDRAFNYTFDGVVYAIVVSLGFTIFENIIYIFRNPSDKLALRIILMIIGNVIFGVFMGYFYGLARYEEGAGDEKNVKKHLAEAVLVPAAMHGFYVFCLRTERPVFIILFAIYEIIITVITVKHFLKLSKTDTLIPGMEDTVSSSDDGLQEGGANEG